MGGFGYEVWDDSPVFHAPDYYLHETVVINRSSCIFGTYFGGEQAIAPDPIDECMNTDMLSWRFTAEGRPRDLTTKLKVESYNNYIQSIKFYNDNDDSQFLAAERCLDKTSSLSRNFIDVPTGPNNDVELALNFVYVHESITKTWVPRLKHLYIGGT